MPDRSEATALEKAREALGQWRAEMHPGSQLWAAMQAQERAMRAMLEAMEAHAAPPASAVDREPATHG